MKRPTRFYSNKQEKKVAKVVGGKQTSNSGATKFSKGDVLLDNWLLECKTSTQEKKSFSIKRDWLKKNKKEMFAMGKHHNALVFDYGDNGDRYYVIDEKTFLDMMEALDREERE
jgi:hypothetical protein